MNKDPAFLMYSKDWIEGTAELSIEAKGIYIDLLCYQHQRGDLPTDLKKIARLVRISESDLQPIWDEIKDKFNQTNDRMVNRKLNQVMTERSEKGKKNKIIGTFASLLRKTDLSRKEYKTIKTSFKVDEFTDTPTERLTERLTEWFNKCLKSIENEDANEDINVNKDESENEKVVFPFDSKDFFKFWQQWKDYKKDEYNFKYKSPASEQAALMKLSKLSNTNEKTATNIIMQSIENGWKGFFELKDKNNAKGLTEERAKSILKDWDD